MDNEIGTKTKKYVEIIRYKNFKPTLIKVDGMCYRLDIAATEKENKREHLTVEERRHRLKQMGRI